MSNRLNKSLKVALKCFEDKNYYLAEIYFKKALEQSPNNTQALNAIGIINGLNNNHIVAVDYFKKASQADPENTSIKFNLANALMKVGDNEKALNLYEKLNVSNPKNFSIKLNYGNCLLKFNKNEEAIKIYLEAIHLDYNRYEPFLNIGIIKQNQNKHNDACIYFHRAMVLSPSNCLVKNLSGQSFNQLGLYKKAIKNFEEILLINQNFVEAHINMGTSYKLLKNFDKAIAIYEKAIKKFNDPKVLEVLYFNLSNVYLEVNDNTFGADYSNALEYAEKANHINPTNASTLNNLGICNLFESKFKDSLKYFEKAYELESNSKTTLINLGTVYYHLGDFENSEKVLRRLNKLYPDEHSRQMMLSEMLLAKNNFKEGWRNYEFRWGYNTGNGRIKPKPNFQKPEWHPGLGYNDILVWGEQGIGDQILHGTMLGDFSKKFKKTYLAIDPKLCDFFKDSYPKIEVFSLFKPIEENFFDYQIPLCSIGLYCREKIDDFFPINVPYKIKGGLNQERKSKLRCAVSWQSKKGHKSDLKSMDLSELKSILEIPEIEFFNIQYSDVSKEVNDLFEKYNIMLPKPENIDIYNDIYKLLNFIDSCDFVITTSNTNAHLAGAIGKKTYLLLPAHQGKFWYWDNFHENTNIWYPTIKKFVQKNQGSWKEPIEELYNFLIKENFSNKKE